MPKISIIVPVYNVENYLKQCMDSLLNQTFSDFELICINDGSTDSCLSILEDYAGRDARIRLISKENEGYGKTMNRGLAEARAPYVGIVESDDFAKPEMFEKLYAAMAEHPVDLVKCNFYKYTTEDGEDIDYSREYPEGIYGQVLEPIDHPALYMAHSSVWAALYDKRFLDVNGIRFNETPGASYQDIAFHFKVLSCAKKMSVIRDALLYYRTDNLMSSVYSPYKVYCICDEIHAAEQYVRGQDGERQKKLWPILMKKKFYDYRWNWKHLAAVFQFAFFEKMVSEFREDYEEGRFEGIEWISPAHKEELNKLLENPFAFFMGNVKEYHDTRIQMAGTQNGSLAKRGFFATIAAQERVVIYGAGKVGRYVARRLADLGTDMGKLLFAVTNPQPEEQSADGIPIRGIEEVLGERKDSFVLIAVKGEKQVEMLNLLAYLGCKNVMIADDEIMSFLR